MMAEGKNIIGGGDIIGKNVIEYGILQLLLRKRGIIMKRKTVLVTGASRGIGKAAAIKFAKHGYQVAICCKQRSTDLEQTKHEVLNYNVPCFSFLGDMGNYSDCERFFKEVKECFGTVDILVNNAGISSVGLLQDMSPKDWDDIVSTNLTSVFNCCRLAIPAMIKKRQGKIINISSVWGIVGASMEVAYSATKGGVNAFTKALAKELAPSQIQVNAIACGAIDTEMNHFMDPEELQELIAEIPVNRLGKTEEVADCIFSIAEMSSYLTGQVIKLDGGWV